MRASRDYQGSTSGVCQVPLAFGEAYSVVGCSPLTQEALMVAIPKVVGVLSCGVLLCLGLSNAASGADEMKAGQADQKDMTVKKPAGHIIQGDVVRVEYGHYVVKQKDGKEVRLETDNTTQMMGQIRKGDRIVATVNDQNHAMSMRSIP